jgi:hypothetical protein
MTQHEGVGTGAALLSSRLYFNVPGAYSLIIVAQIDKPSGFLGEARNTSQLLEEITKWQDKHPLDVPDAHMKDLVSRAQRSFVYPTARRLS